MVYMVIPGVCIFQMTIIYPNLREKMKAGIVKQCMHMSIIIFYFTNVVGNMILSILMESSLKKPVIGEGTYCEDCQMMRPARSWHCKECNVCILRRDHHCTFLARCIGLRNQRYFILFLGYVTFSMIYIIYYNYYFVVFNYSEHFNSTKSLPPLKTFLMYMFLNIVMVILSCALFVYHLWHAAIGVTCYEVRFRELWKTTEWKQNLLNTFGTKWYLAIVWPLCDSPLPNDYKYK